MHHSRRQTMEYLAGFSEYRKTNLKNSIFNTLKASNETWAFHLHGQVSYLARVVENGIYDVTLDIDGQGEEVVDKIAIKFLYPAEVQEKISKLIKKKEKKVEKLKLEPIPKLCDRHFIKNKTLYPLMKEREVVFFTLLEGDLIRGLVLDFTMYDITVGLKGGIPVTLLRHSIYDVRNKAGRCFLKSFQQEAQDWKKSELFIQET